MNNGIAAEILVATDHIIAGRDASDVISALYSRYNSDNSDNLDKLSDLLPIDQISIVNMVDRLNTSSLRSVVILFAVLQKVRTTDAWIHFALAKNFSVLAAAGVPGAKLPAIIHSLLALEGHKTTPAGQPFPMSVLAKELVTVAPREAIRYGMLAARNGHSTALQLIAPAIDALGLNDIPKQPAITQSHELAKALNLGSETVLQATSLNDAAGKCSTVVLNPTELQFPAVTGDESHYIFSLKGETITLPGITVHHFTDGTYSVDASSRGLESHYVFDNADNCVLELANGTTPFVADMVLESDEPVAILDDQFSGAMSVCHFLLDGITRIPIYEKAWSRPGKFFLVDDFPYYREILSHMGLLDRVIVPSSKRVSIRAPELLVSSNISADFRHPAHYCAPWAIDFLRTSLGVTERIARPGRKLFISRADAKGRGILNWTEVKPVLHKHGFDIIELTGLSAATQMAVFRDAQQVAGVHGAGLTNILFAPRDCSVLEILPPMIAVHDYWLLASRLGQRYSALIADDATLPRPDYTSWKHDPGSYNQHDIVLPVDRLEEALAQL